MAGTNYVALTLYLFSDGRDCCDRTCTQHQTRSEILADPAQTEDRLCATGQEFAEFPQQNFVVDCFQTVSHHACLLEQPNQEVVFAVGQDKSIGLAQSAFPETRADLLLDMGLDHAGFVLVGEVESNPGGRFLLLYPMNTLLRLQRVNFPLQSVHSRLECFHPRAYPLLGLGEGLQKLVELVSQTVFWG